MLGWAHVLMCQCVIVLGCICPKCARLCQFAIKLRLTRTHTRPFHAHTYYRVMACLLISLHIHTPLHVQFQGLIDGVLRGKGDNTVPPSMVRTLKQSGLVDDLVSEAIAL
jgi:hypothetical protein